ncbi:MAG: FtsW/RodA/SpoVE family cell cycle protein [Verrucomicrobia bacterium]|nr:FtsW/RodA/SpoVE family cell cycle protein [Verrucomicrobiota bacterium]
MNLASPTEYLNVFKTTTRTKWDVVTPLALVGLGLFGLAFIYSAQMAAHGDDWQKQLIYFGLGAAIYTAVSLVDYRFWLSVAHWLYAASLIPLVVVLFLNNGQNIKWGAHRWIDLGFFSFQPSETAKIAVLLMTASLLVRSKIGTVSQSLGTLGKLALAVGVPMILILKQPDLKSAIVLPPMVFSMLYVSRLSTRFFAGALGAFALLLGIVAWDTLHYKNYVESHKESWKHTEPNISGSWLPLVDYQRNRIVGFVWPDTIDTKGVGWNRSQSIISVGSGGLAGKGWTEGTQAQLGYLPRSVAHNDFIFSVIAEEKGFLGSLSVLGLFGLVLFNGIRIAGSARDRFGTLLAIGVTVLFAVHVFVNIAMTIGLVPITCIPLPFISYGGSFVLSCCLLQGLVQSVWRFRRDFT